MLASRSPKVRWRLKASASWASLTRSASRRISPSSFLGIRPPLLDGDPDVRPPSLAQDGQAQLGAPLGAGQLVSALPRVLSGPAAHVHDHLPRPHPGAVGAVAPAGPHAQV